MRILAPVLLLLTGAAAPDDRDFLISSFERVRVEGPFQVDVVSGSSPSARASGDRAALDGIQIRSEGRTLVIRPAPLGNETRGISPTRVTVTSLPIRAVYVSGGASVTVARMEGARVEAGLAGAGSLEVASVQADSLTASLTGAGTLKIAGKAVQASFGSTGAGSIDATGLIANDLVVRSNTSGEGRFTARYTARVSALGVGPVRVEGAPKCFLDGSGPVSCGNNDNIERR